MFFPCGTDAPIYHWPIATVVLIFVNILAYVVQMSLPDRELGDPPMADPAQDEIAELDPGELVNLLSRQAISEPGWRPYALSHGDGLHPVQWLTSFFMHGGLWHLIGNMIFLWSFGMVVEGKTGPFAFVMLYLSVGVIQNMIEQVLFLGSPAEPSLGASSVLYGLMVMAMFWAPGSNLLCFFIVLIMPLVIRIPILIFAFLYLAIDFGSAMFGGFEMSTPLLHIMGAGVGLVPAILMLQLNLVECEDEDLFSRLRELAGLKPKPKKLTKRQRAEAEQLQLEEKLDLRQKLDRRRTSIDTHLNAGNIEAATKLMSNFRRRGGTDQWNEDQLLKLIRISQSQKNWDRVIDYSNQYLNRFQRQSVSLRINLAKIWILEKESPKRAMNSLEGLVLNELDEKQRQVVRQIIGKARTMIDDGALEFGDE